MALVTQGQKFSSRLSLCVFAPGRETVGPCFLCLPPSLAITPQTLASPLLSSPYSRPPSVKTVRRAGSEISPSLLFFLQLSTKKHGLIFLLWGWEGKRELSIRDAAVSADCLQPILLITVSFYFASRSCLCFWKRLWTPPLFSALLPQIVLGYCLLLWMGSPLLCTLQCDLSRDSESK